MGGGMKVILTPAGFWGGGGESVSARDGEERVERKRRRRVRVVNLQALRNKTSLLKSFTLNADGRNDGGPLLDNDSLQVGTYRLVFSVKPYFKALGVALPEPSFLDQVTLDFGVADTRQHYHVPLLVSPWSFSTYRGS